MNKGRRQETHVFQCPDRTCTVVIRECKDHVKFDMTMSKFGWSSQEDFDAFIAWMTPLADRYKNDPRPIVMPHPVNHPESGPIAVVGGNAEQGWIVHVFDGSERDQLS
jgi:hypothetical protein